MTHIDQQTMEALYSQRNNHTVLHEAIMYELDKLLLTWSLGTFFALDRYLKSAYYDSKDVRVAELQAQIDERGSADWLVVAIVATAIHTEYEQTIQQAVGYLQAFIPHDDPFDRARTAGELLGLLSNKGGLFYIERNGSGRSTLLKVNNWAVINKRLLHSFEWINNTCFNPPMIEKPKQVTNNHGCGYHKIKEPLILGKLTMHEEKQNLKVINSLNSIQWVLDPDVLKETEVPSKPLKTREARENFTKMTIDSKFVYGLLGQEPFYLGWQYDTRGRTYSHGYHVNLQAAEYKKACLSFNHYEVLT